MSEDDANWRDAQNVMNNRDEMDAVIEQRNAAVAERDALKAKLCELDAKFAELEASELHVEKLARYEQALRFYARENCIDQGQRARQALGEPST